MRATRIELDLNQPGAKELLDFAQSKVDTAAAYGRKLTVTEAVNVIVEKWSVLREKSKSPKTVLETSKDAFLSTETEELVEMDGLLFYLSASDETTKKIVQGILSQVIDTKKRTGLSSIPAMLKKVWSEKMQNEKTSSPNRYETSNAIVDAVRKNMARKHPDIQGFSLHAVANMLNQKDSDE